MTSRRHLVPVLAIAAPALALTACGGSTPSGEQAGPASSGPAATTAPTRAPTTAPGTGPTSTTGAGTTTGTAGGSSTTTGPATTSGGPSRCRSENLRMAIGSKDGATGHRYTTVIFTNPSVDACTMRGWPGLSYTKAGGGDAGPAARRGGANPPLVTVPAGGTAHVLFDVQQAAFFDPTACGTVVEGATLRVYPPDETGALAAPDTVPLCSNDVGQLTVYPVHPGSTASAADTAG